MPPRLWLAALTLAVAAAVAACNPSGDPAPAPSATNTASGNDDGNTGQTTQDLAPTATPGDVLGTPSIDPARIHSHIQELSVAIGPRVAGSAGERAAIDYIAAHFTATGYSVELHDFAFDPSAYRYGTVEVGDAQQIEALALVGSPGGTASGRAVYVGTADSASVTGLDLAGAVAIADRDQRTFRDKLSTVRNAGAVALVIINREPGPFTGQLQLESPFPVVGVGSEHRDPLRAAGDGAQILTVSIPAAGMATSTNVVARADPDAPCDILVGGHHDSVPGAPGANDNASGTAHVLELARVFAADGLDPGLCFATFGAEEFGLFGSAALATDWSRSEQLPQFMVNLDVTGAGDTIELIGGDELVSRAATLARQLAIPAEPSSLPPNASSDHASFATFNVQVILVSSGMFPFIHTPADIIEAIDTDTLERIGLLAHAMVDQLLAEIAGD